MTRVTDRGPDDDEAPVERSKRPWRGFRRLMPYLGAIGIILLSATLVGTVFLTESRLPWQAFLGGALMAATLALASRTSNSAWTIARRDAQLDATRTRLASETVMRNRAERALENINAVVRYMDELLPAMVAYVDSDYRIALHNRAYAHWLDAGSMRLEGRTLQELFGAAVFQTIRARADEAFAGRLVRYERVHMRRNGEPCRISVQCLPHFGARGAVAGVFLVLTDITSREDMTAAAAGETGGGAAQWRERRPPAEGRNGGQGVTKARAVLYRKAVDVNSLFRLSSQ